MKSKRSGHTGSAPSFSKSSAKWLLASGKNLTKISPTIPTLGFLSSEKTIRAIDRVLYVLGVLLFAVAAFAVIKGQIGMFLIG